MPRRVVLDACVLYPPSLRDLLLTLAALDVYDVAWSDAILDEVVRNVVADHPDIDAGRFRDHTIGAMRTAFPNATAPTDPDVAVPVDVHAGDRHVVATAVTTAADAIVTINVRHLPLTTLDALGITVHTPGELIGLVLDTEPDLVVAAVEHISARWTNPPRTPREIVELIARHPTLAEPAERLERLLS